MSDQLQFDEQGEGRLRLASAGPAARPAAAAPADSFTIEEPHLLDYVRVLYKRRWTAATAFLLVFVSVAAYTFTVTPIYEAKARLLIEAEDQNVVNFKQVVDEDQTKADYYQTQYNMLQSRALARKTIDDLHLWDTAPFGGAQQGFSVRKAVFGAPAALAAGVGRLFRHGDAASDHTNDNQIPGADETAAQSRAIDTFLADLDVAPIRNSRLVDLKVRLADPVAATRVANTLAKNYIQQNLEYKFMASKEASDWLGDRLAEQRKSVEAAESKLQQYREQNDAISLQDRENIVVQKLADINAAVTRAKTDRIQKEALYDQLRKSQNNPSLLDTFPAILMNSFIQQQKSQLSDLQRQYAQMSDKLGDKHPDIIRIKSAIAITQQKLETEIAKVVQSVKSDYEASLAQEQSLQAALNQQKQEAFAMNRKGIDASVLERDVQSSRQIYDSLLQRAKETGVSGELKTSNIRIVDKAEQPRHPATPKTLLNLVLGLFGGGVLAFGLTFFFEYLDSRIKSPDEIKAHLGLPALGLIPALDPKSWKGKEPLINAGVPPNFAEAFRGVRTNVLFSSAEEGSRSIVVTSTGPGEGKTTVAVNLAVGFAQAGQRVLLIDADMRRPRVHDVFGQSQEPGLSNLMVGNAKASESVRKCTVPNLWVLTAGRIPPNPAELLGSVRFRDFLGSLKEHFDWVIIDSPPVMAVTDATIAANSASGVVFVVGAEMTSRHAAKTAIEQLAHGRVHFVGAVLNRVELEKNAYYYSHYYRREYGAYYQQAVGQK
ncbi:MAG TPA: polysaccharide biosynthesis tyrosine autokinase [Vicinamibacterales bacterium]|nr:polysaccharide biosynthesis tyrosine autokinase [Vicinamibacterales bacterium]